MFLYVKNRYNICPNLVLDSEKNDRDLYLSYMPSRYLLLPKTLDEFHNSHKSKFWYNIRRSERLYQDEFGELVFSIVTNDDIDVFLDKVFVLFNSKWNKEYISSDWKCKKGFDRYKSALIDMSKTGEAFLAVLHDSNSKLLSYAYCINDSQTVYFYQFTTTVEKEYLKFSLGKILIYKLLSHLIEKKDFVKFDFMIGEQEYKKEWAKHSEVSYIRVRKGHMLSYPKYFLYKLKTYLQKSTVFRSRLKNILTIKERLFGKC